MLNPRYAEVAHAYGIPYDVVIDRKDLKAKVEKMIATKGPYLLECAIKEDEDIVPMTLPGKSVDEMIERKRKLPHSQIIHKAMWECPLKIIRF